MMNKTTAGYQLQTLRHAYSWPKHHHLRHHHYHHHHLPELVEVLWLRLAAWWAVALQGPTTTTTIIIIIIITGRSLTRDHVVDRVPSVCPVTTSSLRCIVTARHHR